MGIIYKALKKAEREAMHQKEKNNVQEVTSQADTYQVGPPPASVKKATADKKPSSMKGKRYKVPYEKMRKKFSSSDKISEELLILNQPHSFLSEQFRIFRTRYLSLNKDKSMRTILVTSALAKEGKTMVASNLAISIAQGFDEHVLLIDADLRKPTLHERFTLKPNDGLVGFLNNEHRLTDVLQKTDLHNLTILPSGKPPENPSKLIASAKMHQLVEDIKARYEDRFIIFDSSPVQQTSEPTILAKQVDGILLVVHAGKTDRELVKKTVGVLGKDKILGIIFNHSSETIKYYYNYYYQPKK